MKVLVTAAIKYGATGEIAQAVGEGLRKHGLEPRSSRPSRSRGSSATTRSYSAAPCMPGTG
jgi:menaquinone-dependent protoporphyrinogen IX oxidase